MLVEKVILQFEDIHRIILNALAGYSGWLRLERIETSEYPLECFEKYHDCNIECVDLAESLTEDILRGKKIRAHYGDESKELGIENFEEGIVLASYHHPSLFKTFLSWGTADGYDDDLLLQLIIFGSIKH